MRSVGAVAILGLLAGCGTEKSSSDTSDIVASSESLDRNELSEELIGTLVSEQAPQGTCLNLTVNPRYLLVGSAEQMEVRYTPGRQPLPQIFHLQDASRHEFDPLINAGVLSSEHIRDYEVNHQPQYTSGYKARYYVYKIDFTPAARSSPAFRINENHVVSNDRRTIASVCLGQRKISNVQYVLPNEGSHSTATFTWNIEVTDPLVQNVLNSGYWTRPPAQSGQGRASLVKTNTGWTVSNVEL